MQLNQDVQKFITITNPSQNIVRVVDLKHLKDVFSITGKDFPGTGGDCGKDLAKGESCKIAITVHLRHDFVVMLGELVFVSNGESHEQWISLYAKRAE